MDRNLWDTRHCSSGQHGRDESRPFKWFGEGAEMIDIGCPRCGARAEWDEPFEFLGGRRAREAEGLPQWGGWRVREKYPSVFPWRPPRTWSRVLWHGGDQRRDPGGYRLRHHGVVRCPACHLVARHRLHWPADAYFQWSIRGGTLWAWNAEDARVLLHYVESTLRVPERYPGYARWLRKLPALFLAARNRGLVARRIRATLAEAGIAPLDGFTR